MKRLDLSIGQRLGIGFSLILLLLGSLIGLMYYWNAQSARAQDAFTQRIAPLSSAAEDLQGGVLQVAISVRGLLIRADTARLQRFAKAEEAARAALGRLAEIPKEPDGERAYKVAAPLVERYLADASVLARQLASGARKVAGEEDRLAGAREQAMDALEQFSAVQGVKTAAALQAIRTARESSDTGLAIAALLALGLFGVTTVVVIRSIRKPTLALLVVADAMQRGNWPEALALSPKEASAAGAQDEMTRLAHAFGAAATALEAREQRLRVDREIASASSSSLLKNEIAHASLRAIGDYVNGEVGVLYWMDDAAELLAPIAVRGLRMEDAAPAMDGIPGRAIRERKIIVVRDIPPDTPFKIRLGYDEAVPRTVVAVPIWFHESVLGVLVIGLLHDLDPAHLQFLEDAAVPLAIGLQNIKAYERVQALLADLAEKSQRIQAQNEELQAQNEELQAQSEELQAQGEEIRAQNEQLKDQADSLHDHAHSLEQADRRKSEFLAVLAHELRNPMAAISSSLNLLTHASGDTDYRARALGVMDRQTRMLARLVDDLLDVTRVSSGKVVLQVEDVDLTAIVRECAEDYRDHAEKVGIRLDIQLPTGEIGVKGDRTRLCQIVGILIDNAIKFSNGDKYVAVSLAASGGKAELRVSDRGIGIAAEMLDRLFQPFHQADVSLARRRGGLGLGLAIAKSLVEMQGGRIQARSDGPGKGSEFVVTLPLLGGRLPAAAHRREQDETQRGRGRRILIIEDNLDAAHSLRDTMELAGHEVRVAFEATEGIAIAREFHPEVLLCDIGLPDMDGYQVAKTFRSEDRLRSTFLIAVTGYAAPEDRERALQAGFDRHIGKPADIEKLKTLLNQAGIAHKKP